MSNKENELKSEEGDLEKEVESEDESSEEEKSESKDSKIEESEDKEVFSRPVFKDNFKISKSSPVLERVVESAPQDLEQISSSFVLENDSNEKEVNYNLISKEENSKNYEGASQPDLLKNSSSVSRINHLGNAPLSDIQNNSGPEPLYVQDLRKQSLSQEQPFGEDSIAKPLSQGSSLEKPFGEDSIAKPFSKDSLSEISSLREKEKLYK